MNTLGIEPVTVARRVQITREHETPVQASYLARFGFVGEIAKNYRENVEELPLYTDEQLQLVASEAEKYEIELKKLAKLLAPMAVYPIDPEAKMILAKYFEF